MTRKQALAVLRAAGYHEDTASFVRVYVENRVSYAAARKAYAEGIRAKLHGVVCACSKCKPAGTFWAGR